MRLSRAVSHVIALTAIVGLLFYCAGGDDGDSDSSGSGSGDGSADNGTMDAPSDSGQTDGGTTSGQTDGGPTGPSSVTVAGQIGIATDTTAVIALPVRNNTPAAADALDAQVAPATAGAFQVAIDLSGAMNLQDQGQRTSHVMMVTDGAKSKFEQAADIQFITMPVGSEGLVGIPTGAAVTDSLDLGAIAAAGDSLVAATAASSALFAIEDQILAEFARIDDTLRAAKNAYVNSDADSGVIADAKLSFEFQAAFSQALLSEVPYAPTWDAANPAATSNDPEYRGFNVTVETTHPLFSYGEFCETKHKVGLLPPTAALESADSCADQSAVPLDQQWPCVRSGFSDPTQPGAALRYAYNLNLDTNEYYGPNDLDPDNLACNYGWPVAGQGDYGISISHNRGDDFETNHVLQFGGPLPFVGAPIPGLWDITVDDQTVMRFDLAVATPTKSETVGGTDYTYLKMYVPTFSFVRNADNVLTGMRVAFWLYNFDAANPANSRFERVTDLSTVIATVSQFGVGVDNDEAPTVDQRIKHEMPIDLKTATIENGIVIINDPGFQQFAFPNTDGSFDSAKKLVWSAGINMNFFGQNYNFKYFCRSTSDVQCRGG